MKFRSVALLLWLVLIAGSGLAHGDKKHVRGLLEKISADSVVVKTAEGKICVSGSARETWPAEAATA